MTNIEQIAQSIIDEYELDYNNAEIIVGDDGCQLTVEAPNHATVTVDISFDSTDEGNEKATMLKAIADKIKHFNTDEEFNELWSDEFGEHNHFKPSQFFRMLSEDEDYFKQCSEKMYQELEGVVRNDR